MMMEIYVVLSLAGDFLGTSEVFFFFVSGQYFGLVEGQYFQKNITNISLSLSCLQDETIEINIWNPCSCLSLKTDYTQQK